jgi:hypothetical protein
MPTPLSTADVSAVRRVADEQSSARLRLAGLIGARRRD